jgi:hypothetical protein
VAQVTVGSNPTLSATAMSRDIDKARSLTGVRDFCLWANAGVSGRASDVPNDSRFPGKSDLG